MQTLSYGYKLPEINDSGDALWTALEDNISRLNDHNHDGVDSPSLTAQSVVASTATISSASWVAHGATGHYRQQVTVPAGFDIDTVQVGFRTSAGAVIFPTMEKVSDTQYFVYTTDNTLTMTAIYGG